jgi:hypothetical protein
MLKRRDTQFEYSGPSESKDTGSALARSGNDSPKKLKKPSWASRDELKLGQQEERELTASLSSLKLVHTKTSRAGYVETKHWSPWSELRLHFPLELEDGVAIATPLELKDPVAIATRNYGETDFVAVRRFIGPDAGEKVGVLRAFQKARAPNFLAFLDDFSHEECRYVVFEHTIAGHDKLGVTLDHFSLTAEKLTQQQLVLIINQVIPLWEHPTMILM